jgi:hypothetical protein
MRHILEVAMFTRAISSVTMGHTNIPSGSNIFIHSPICFGVCTCRPK